MTVPTLQLNADGQQHFVQTLPGLEFDAPGRYTVAVFIGSPRDRVGKISFRVEKMRTH
jgi:hypothetical protein